MRKLKLWFLNRTHRSRAVQAQMARWKFWIGNRGIVLSLQQKSADQLHICKMLVFLMTWLIYVPTYDLTRIGHLNRTLQISQPGRGHFLSFPVNIYLQGCSHLLPGMIQFELPHKKTNNLHMRKQRRRSAVQ